MGAILISFTLPGTLNTNQVRYRFKERRSKDFLKRDTIVSFATASKREWFSTQNGTSPYTPDFYSFEKIKVVDKTFPSLFKAKSYCAEHSEKWFNCVAVKISKPKLKWLICGWGPI